MRIAFIETLGSHDWTTIRSVGELARHEQTSRAAALAALGLLSDPLPTSELWAEVKGRLGRSGDDP